MPIPSSHMKERLHLAYVNAVASRAGAKCTKPDPDYGDDVIIQEVRQLPNGKFTDSGFLFHCQLKASTTCEVRDDVIVYDMEVDSYNKMIEWEGGYYILILFVMPEDELEWLHLDEDRFLLKKCCYWQEINGEISRNRKSQRIFIPRSQLFTPETVRVLLDKVRRDIFS